MNGNLSSTESVADNLENIPEIEIAFFHEEVLLFFSHQSSGWRPLPSGRGGKPVLCFS
jgi:hypothetical protein